MKSIQSLIGSWNSATFPKADTAAFLDKLYEEVNELSAAIADGPMSEEMADVAIVLMSWADREGVDLESEILKKMRVNQCRSMSGRWTPKG